jgi:Ca2+-binding RTX toxin-like protein
MTAAQYSGFTGGITAGGGAEQITLTSELGGAAILNANVETFVLAAGAANSVTSGANGQTINAGALADAETLTLAGTHNVTASLVAGDLASISTGNITVNATTGTNVITTGGGNDTINAGGGDDIISGGGGADFLDGGEGADVIDGGAGADWIMLGGGADVLVLNQTATADTIIDYTVADDTIHLSKAVYTSLAAAVGAVDLGAEFATLADVNALDGGSVAASTNANDFIFLRGTGALYYNADGATAGGLVLVGTFQGGALLVGSEFTVIA